MYDATASLQVMRSAQNNNSRLIFTAFQTSHIAVFYSFLGGGTDASVLASSGVVNILLYSWLLTNEFYSREKALSPIIFYLAASVFRIGIGTIYTVLVYESDSRLALNVGIYDVSDFLMEGHWLAMIGDLCFILGYFAFVSRTTKVEKRRNIGVTLATKRTRTYQIACLFMICAFCIRVLGQFITFGGLGQLAGYVGSYGPSAALYVMLSVIIANRNGIRSKRAVFIVLIGLVNAAWSLFSYMKSDLFIALLPFMLIAAQSGMARDRRMTFKRLFWPVIFSAFFLVFFLFVVSAYSESRRSEFWIGTERKAEYDVEVIAHVERALLAVLPWTEENTKMHRFPDRGAWNMIARMSVTNLTAWSYARVDSRGVRPDSFFESVLVAVTPRVVWPDKPLLSPGADFHATIGLATSGATATSATALTLQGAYYWWGGMLALIVGCFVTGSGFAVLLNIFSSTNKVNPISALITMVLCFEGFNWFESAFLGSFPFYLYALIVFLPLRSFFNYLILDGVSRKVGTRGLMEYEYANP